MTSSTIKLAHLLRASGSAPERSQRKPSKAFDRIAYAAALEVLG